MTVTDFSHIKGVIWDLDGTLYRYDDLFRQACSMAAARTVIDLGLQMSFDDALALATKSENLHGNSFRLFADHGVRYEDFHMPYHTSIDAAIVRKNAQMRDALAAVSVPMVILTNASRDWAMRTMNHLELGGIFGDGNILCLEDVGFQSKAAGRAGFEKALSIIGTEASATLMVEDLAPNLIHAKAMGMTTALVHHGVIPDGAGSYVDGFFADTLELVRLLPR